MTSSRNYASPLRYPGGKTKLTTLLEDIILLNNLENCTFYELYAGGAGAALNLLFSGICSNIILNDYDFHVFAFWDSILNNTDEFLALLNDTKVNIETWSIQRRIHTNYEEFSILEVGFSTFFLNRTNRSGILHGAGPIGGFDQTGNYKIDVRFNKNTLENRIKKIATFKDKISLYSVKAIPLLQEVFAEDRTTKFLFLDPPYYNQGDRLYLNSYVDADHERLRDVLIENKNENWFLTYDNCKKINDLYSTFRRGHQSMSYTLQEKKEMKETRVFSDSLNIPKRFKIGSNARKLVLDGLTK